MKFRTSFENFIVGKSNQQAVDVLNELFLYKSDQGQFIFLEGPYCSGKTLLIHSFLKSYHRNFPRSNTVIETCESIVCKILENYKHNEEAPIVLAPNCDVLIIEDIDFVAYKPATQEILLKLLLKQMNTGTLIIVSANLNSRLVNSFENSGLNFTKLTIKDADKPLRQKIMDYKLSERKIKLNRRITSEMINSEMTMSQLLGVIQTITFAKEVLNVKITMRVYKRISAKHIH